MIGLFSKPRRMRRSIEIIIMLSLKDFKGFKINTTSKVLGGEKVFKNTSHSSGSKDETIQDGDDCQLLVSSGPYEDIYDCDENCNHCV